MSYTSTICLHCGCITYGSDSLPVKTSILHLHCPKCGWEFAYQKDKTMLGWSKQVQEAIGIPIEAFDNLEKNVCSLSSSLTESVERNQKLIKENNTLKNKLQSLRSMTFWQKLKFLFTNKEEQNEQV